MPEFEDSQESLPFPIAADTHDDRPIRFEAEKHKIEVVLCNNLNDLPIKVADAELTDDASVSNAPTAAVVACWYQSNSHQQASTVLLSPNIYTFEFDWADWGTHQLRGLESNDLRVLHRLGLTERQYQCFLRFVGHPFGFCYKGIAGWLSPSKNQDGVDWPLRHSDLYDHLARQKFIATGARRYRHGKKQAQHTTWYFVFDIDWPKGLETRAAADEMHSRYRKIVAAVGEPSVVFRSSDSGGLHLYYLLSHPVDLFRLKSPSGSGAIERLVQSSGLPLKNGVVEFYPTAALKGRSRGNRLRLPFGRGSQLLCPKTLEPLVIGDNLANLRFFSSQLESSRIGFYDFDSFYQRASRLPRERRPRARKHPIRRRSGRSAPLPGARTGGTATDLLANGLAEEGKLDASVFELFHYFRLQGKSRKWTIERIASWAANHHNGVSKTFNGSETDGDSEVRHKVAALFKRFGEYSPTPIRLPSLSRRECDMILGATSDSNALLDQRGSAVKQYVIERVLFESFQHHKHWVLESISREWNQLHEDYPLLDVNGDEFFQAFAKNVAAEHPDASESLFVVPWPDAKRATLKGMKSGSCHRYWFVAQKLGLYQLTSAHDWVNGRCARYQVLLDFLDDGTTTFSDVSEAIRCVRTAVELASYSRHYQREIARKLVSTRSLVAPHESLRLLRKIQSR